MCVGEEKAIIVTNQIGRSVRSILTFTWVLSYYIHICSCNLIGHHSQFLRW